MATQPAQPFVHTSEESASSPTCRPVYLRALFLLTTATSCVTLLWAAQEPEPIALQGIVHDGQQPIAGATVRIQATERAALTDSTGHFTLLTDDLDNPICLTATAPGFYIGGGQLHRVGEPNIEIVLERHHTGDDRDYSWVSAFSHADDKQNCQNCHSDPQNPGSQLPFDQWVLDAHARSAKNPRFLTMYLGTDVHGNQSPPTRFAGHPDYGLQPLRPADGRPYYGPGYRLDFPTTNGNCAACHAPVAAIDDPYGVDPSELTGVASEGVGCDFCHKIADVNLDPVTQLPLDNRPGVMSFTLQRPAPGHQYFAGPFDDVAPGEDVYSPLQNESRYCAPCHSASFWDVEVYNSYGEWLASPYAHADSMITCQDCHMPPGLTAHFARPDSGGKRRDPNRIFGHRMPGAEDEALLRNAVDMTVETKLVSEGTEVRVGIVNSRTGHHVPTDSPLRHMILLVQAVDDTGEHLSQLHGPVLPDWCGVGDPMQGYLAGLPGKVYAKVLKELWTGVSPTGAYWNQTRLVSDNRIPAFGSDTSNYRFDAPASGRARIEVRLLYRRAFIELRDWKSWEGTDLEMARHVAVLGERMSSDSSHPPPEVEGE